MCKCLNSRVNKANEQGCCCLKSMSIKHDVCKHYHTSIGKMHLVKTTMCQKVTDFNELQSGKSYAILLLWGAIILLWGSNHVSWSSEGKITQEGLNAQI